MNNTASANEEDPLDPPEDNELEAELERTVDLGSTTPGIEESLHQSDFFILIGRTRDSDRKYKTTVNTNRTVRRLYAIGLLFDAQYMLGTTNSEVVIGDGLPGVKFEAK